MFNKICFIVNKKSCLQKKIHREKNLRFEIFYFELTKYLKFNELLLFFNNTYYYSLSIKIICKESWRLYEKEYKKFHGNSIENLQIFYRDSTTFPLEFH